ncbi:hypothetical protein BH11VER1_BH11VER1_41920 [soil metagenome]
MKTKEPINSKKRNPIESAESTEMHTNAADGYLDLGAPKEVLQELKALDESGIHSNEITAFRINALSMLEGPTIAGPFAFSAVEQGVGDSTTMEIAIIEALNLNNPALAARLAENYIDQNGSLDFEVWNNLACAQTQLGQYEKALTSLFKSLLGESVDPLWPLLDAHLAPLWHYVADGRFSTKAAKTLTHRLFKKLAEDVDKESGLRSICWYTANTLAPKIVVPYLKRNRYLGLDLRPRTPANIRKSYLCWLDNRRHRMARLLRKAIQQAHQIYARELAELYIKMPPNPFGPDTKFFLDSGFPVAVEDGGMFSIGPDGTKYETGQLLIWEESANTWKLPDFAAFWTAIRCEWAAMAP